LKVFAVLFGIIFFILGIAGFLPGALTGNYLFEIFKINFWLNIISLASGIAAWGAAFIGQRACRLYFQMIGTFYAFLAILGFIYGESEIFDMIANNKVDTWLHMVFAISAWILGYGSME
jgi:hypothetical protein